MFVSFQLIAPCAECVSSESAEIKKQTYSISRLSI